MSIYNLTGAAQLNPYNVDGSVPQYAYNVGGEIVWRGSGVPLTVMTYNVQRFEGINSQQTMQNIIANTYDADIIGMQELGSSGTIPAVGQNMLANYSYRQLSNSGNRTLTATKTLPLTNIVIADYENQDPQDWSMRRETRSYTKMDVEIDGKVVSIINTHLCYLTPSVKYLQMKELFDIAEQCDRVIITGDFNSMQMSATADDYLNMYKQFVDAGYHLANNSPASGFQNTYSSSNTASSLNDLETAPDTIIVSPNIAINSVVFDQTKFSYLNGHEIDHIPVIARLVVE